ncbi:hypothetical protein N7449_004992 [Penicillium cf. viridicatum]|uniref:FAD-binding PCMH-type domain-containing protein n=1 Tax=Penicillium cf. viridicatum TaxID=2972119 RepID=A0A9W9MKB0_9EURO|nr:hypothetical protein N7449_004992 [Penicillium cf. viridicatum]
MVMPKLVLLLLEVTCESDGYFAPESEAATAKFLKEQYPKGSYIKVVGNGHGFGNLTTYVDNSLTEKPSYIVSMTNLQKLDINKKDMTVTFGAGWDVYDLTEELKANGLTFGNLGVERVQNFVGAVSTGTYGSGSDIGNIGHLRVINEINNPEELKAFRISLGALGLITEMTIKV